MNNCPTCSGPMVPLFTGSFCPKDCDRRPPVPAWRAKLLRKISPESGPVIERAGWLDTNGAKISRNPSGSYEYWKPSQCVPADSLRTAEWVVQVYGGELTVLKNRFGELTLDGIPDYER